MKEASLLEAKEILRINTPEKLFLASNESDLKKVYRKLSQLWHPDRHITDGKDTTATFAHIQFLYDKALERMANGEWNKANLFKVTAKDNSKYEIRYLTKVSFEFGTSYISKTVVAYEFNKGEEDFADRYVNSLRKLKFANDKMKEEISKYIPEIVKVIYAENSTIIVVKKDNQSISLRDVLNHYKNFVDPKHVAWILSGMYNIACFNQYNGLMQAGFSLDNYFINPSSHLGQLIGGWCFTHQNQQKLTALPTEAVNVAPVKMLNNKIADIKLDLELIKLVGKQLLGDPSGVKLRTDKRVPKAMVEWLNDSADYKAFVAYELWEKKVLQTSFGVRRFTKMELTLNDIYN